MRIIDLTIKDLKQLTRDWQSALFLVIMPVVFTLMFGFMFGGFDTSEEVDPRLPVAFLDLDNGEYSPYLVDLLAESDVIRLVQEKDADLEALRKQLRDDDLAGIIVVPDGYSAAMSSDESLKLKVIVDSESLSAITVQNSVAVAANRLSSVVLTARLSVAAYEEQNTFSDGNARQAYFESAVDKALLAWEDPPIQTRNTQTGAVAVEEEEQDASWDNAFVHTSPAMMAQFSLAGLIGAAAIIVEERKSRSLQRLLTTPISKAQILIGHYLAMFVMIFAQFILLIAFGQLLLQLDYASQWGATLLLVVVTSMSVAALGLLIGALSKTQENAVVLSLVPMFILSGLGGAWVPLEFTNETVQTIGHFTPVAWIMDGFKTILSRGLGLEAIWLSLVVLLGFTVLWFSLAVWRFRFE
ncbi:MAG: ABC transporter permease [Anaerolineales bacterium]|jgi:ABC-2 type transport system permease protein